MDNSILCVCVCFVLTSPTAQVIYKDGSHTVLLFNMLSYYFILLECKLEMWNSQLEHRQPMEQTRSLFCTCDSGVAPCQSQHKSHVCQMNSMFEVYCTGL